jgi:hypothetical protein
MYANRQEARDGFIPERALPMLYPLRSPSRMAAKLVEVGLWERVPGGYLIHGYHDYNPTKEQVEEERAKGRERASRSYRRRKEETAPPSPEDSGVSSPEDAHEDETKKRVSSGLVWFGVGSGSLPEGVQGEVPPTDDAETTCPPDLERRAVETGVVRQFATRYRVTEEQVVEAVREFASYWTIGGGMGERRRHWMRRLRQRLQEQCEQKRLKPPGAIEHEQTLSDLDRKRNEKLLARARKELAG